MININVLYYPEHMENHIYLSMEKTREACEKMRIKVYKRAHTKTE